MTRAYFVLVLLAGCEKDLLAGMHDAGVDTPVVVDAAPIHCTAPATDAHAAAMYTLFVSIEGVTLTPCGDNDARTNCSTLVQQETAFPRFLDGNVNRAEWLDDIFGLVRMRLAPFSIDVVTTRPASGDYQMIVIGGTPALVGVPSNVAGIAPFKCGQNSRNNVSIVFDQGELPTRFDYANSILSDTGVFAGIPGATLSDDCLCRGAGNCRIDRGKACTYGVDVPVDPSQFGCGQTRQDEQALMRAFYGCR
jgi:hypothetical protein